MNMQYWTLKRTLRTIWIVTGIVFTLWLCYSMQAHGVDKALLKSDNLLQFENTEQYYCYTPKASFIQVLFFYPGALVEPKSYIPLCRELATEGIKVYLIKMPWRQATRGYNIPKTLGLFDDAGKTYILVGHSQGGKMAAQFVYENPGVVDQLILIGTTHPLDISLGYAKIPILKIYGSRDGVSDEASIMDNKVQLPTSAQFVRIEGGNHSQYGYYGFQLGDKKATIDREQQQVETLRAMLTFINE
ncbi:alpha/beta hydrolase [Mangrovimonas xylaniphaga]|uniref:alpha/beta hydrolase n=1 Tax=Mangrovimonas xylaniphaga TaxID=1645915 RepID=UPI0009E6A77A|nr:alpha/beta hydrolase [Mangrovimonas xylaniphaga]